MIFCSKENLNIYWKMYLVLVSFQNHINFIILYYVCLTIIIQILLKLKYIIIIFRFEW